MRVTLTGVRGHQGQASTFVLLQILPDRTNEAALCNYKDTHALLCKSPDLLLTVAEARAEISTTPTPIATCDSPCHWGLLPRMAVWASMSVGSGNQANT